MMGSMVWPRSTCWRCLMAVQGQPCLCPALGSWRQRRLGPQGPVGLANARHGQESKGKHGGRPFSGPHLAGLRLVRLYLSWQDQSSFQMVPPQPSPMLRINPSASPREPRPLVAFPNASRSL